MSGANYLDPEYVAARRVLLDALEALGIHRKALVLVGAQAIYLQIGEGDQAVAPYTTDADLAIDPERLGDEPALTKALEESGFELTVRPGTWTKTSSFTQVDFLVPTTLGGGGRRGARLGVHGDEFARKSKGLEAVIIDNSIFRIGALDPNDLRSFEIAVAGPAALLVAKLHKIADRKDDLNRLQDKDGLDVLRILRACASKSLATKFVILMSNDISKVSTREALSHIKDLFGRRNSVGSQMAVRASSGLEDEVTVAMSCEALTVKFLQAMPKSK